MAALVQSALSPFAEEFKPMGNFASPPPGLECVLDGAETALTPPGLHFDTAPPPGLTVPPGLNLDAPSKMQLLEEETKRLLEENLRLSNQRLEIESARLAKENAELRAQLMSKTQAKQEGTQAPPGVWDASGPPGVFVAPGPPGVWADVTPVPSKAIDECSEDGGSTTCDDSDGSSDNQTDGYSSATSSPTSVTSRRRTFSEVVRNLP